MPRGVEQLSLEIRLEQHLVLPRSLFSCTSTTLVVLKLGFDILIDPPSASSIALLCILYVSNMQMTYLSVGSSVVVKYANDVSFCWLLSGCPILQILVVKAIGLKSKCKFQIVVQTLKKLYIWINCEAYVLEINAPALKYLHFSGMLCSGILLENSFYLVEADINIYGQLPWDFIRQLYNVKSLHLSNGTMWVRHFFLGLYLNCYTLFL